MDDIFLICGGCCRAFYIQDLTDDEGDTPNPQFCPFCGESSRLNELDDIDEVIRDARFPPLRVLQGGLASGDKIHSKEERHDSTPGRSRSAD